MGDQKRQMDILKMKMDALKDSYEQILKIQGEQAILMSVLIRKAEVTQDEITEETERLNANIKKRQKDLERSQVQPEGTGSA